MNTLPKFSNHPIPLRVDPLEEMTRGPRVHSGLSELKRSYYYRYEASVREMQSFFGDESAHLVNVRWELNLMDHLMIQRAVAALLDGWRVVREHCYSEKRASLVERCAVEVAPGRFDFVIRFGRQYWEGPKGEKLVSDLYTDDDDRKSEYCQVTFTVAESRHDWLRTLLPRLREWANAHHFLRGQPFNAKGEFIRSVEPVEWDDVILSDAVRDSLRRNCIDLLKHAALYKANGIPLKRGIVLHGPPGTGKSMIGRVLARHCGVTFILTTPGMIEEPSDVRRIFLWGRRFAPSILFFEDFDLVARNRYDGGPREVTGEFLSCLDGLDSSEGVIAIATTNNLHAIEPALKDRPNRFDCVLEIPALGQAERREFLERWRVKNGAVFDVGRWAARTGGFTGAQLQELCRLGVFEAVEERVRSGRVTPERIPLQDAHLDRAIRRMNVKSSKSIGFTADASE